MLRLIPLPANIVPLEGEFTVGPNTHIILDVAQIEAMPVAETLAGLFRRPDGQPLPITIGGPPTAGEIRLTPDPSITTGEGYRLLVMPERISIAARTARGLFYGVQTLRQLAPVEIETPQSAAATAWRLPAVEIKDAPRFPYRGMHLDVGRHWFPAPFIKQYIDLLAAYKFNTFHWHLTDDQGWRMEIKQYPRLTTVGAQRRETHVGVDENGAPMFDGTPYGGFYTQDQVREIVRYAEQRFITVMPEIELPGHSRAALAAYPVLGCTPGPFEVGTRWGVYDDILCPSEATFTFLENVLAEVLDLFPSPFIHVGGDEVPTRRWAESPAVQALMARESLGQPAEVHGYFMRRAHAFLAKHGRRMVGWDEMLDGNAGALPDAVVMSWRGQAGGLAGARQGQDVVMTPHEFTYFDHYQATPAPGEPLALLPVLPIEKVYGFEPVPAELDEAQAGRILGAQGNVWTEWIRTSADVLRMALPRMLALAEVVWSPRAARDWASFSQRLQEHPPARTESWT
jgi:hexosaminidase